jgi:hypothetical protein
MPTGLPPVPVHIELLSGPGRIIQAYRILQDNGCHTAAAPEIYIAPSGSGDEYGQIGT